MIALLCMLIVFGLSHGNDLPSKIEVENSINRTINEVERLIRQNSTLPQLTKHEIVDILLNITTSKTSETFQNKETMEKARKMYERALLVVLPYNAKDAKENINDLYTKPPIVQIIADSSSDSKDFNVWKNEKLQFSTPTQEMQFDEEPLENLVVTHASEKENPSVKIEYKNHRETYSEAYTKTPLKETLKFDESAPIKFSFNLDNLDALQREPAITEVPVTRQAVFQEESSSTKNKEIHIVYSTSATTMRPIGTSPKKENTLAINSKELQTTPPPLKYNENVLSVNQWRYNAPTTAQSLTSTKDSPFKISLEDVVAPTVISKIKNIPDISKIPFEKIQMADAKQSTSIYVTPTSFSSPSSSSENLKFNSTYSLNSGGFRKITTTTTTMRPEVMELLASIGLRPENSTNVEEVFKNQESLKSKSEIFNSNGFIPTISGLTAVIPDSPSIIAQNTFENPVSELGKGMNNLTPDVQLLFQRFGLQTSNLVTTTTSTPRSTVNINSYTNFKPLPMSKVRNEDMKEFLAKFGLGISDNRQKKAISVSTERPSLIEVVPDSMRQILENIGLISRKVSKTTPKIEDMEPKNTTKFHVFKPHEVQVKDERQKMKINELLDIINKLIQEGKTNTKDMQKIADDLLLNTKTLKDGPDPLYIDEIIRTYNEDVKNEVKRQNPEEIVETTTIGDENSTTTTTTESTDVSSTSSTTMTTPITSDSAKNGSVLLDTLVLPDSMSSTSTSANLVALEESFGGTTRAPDPVLPTKRRSGLYFLVDWNSFLEVGDDDREKVNLRFQPKVGDRTRFLPVRIP
ncbi:uncharacterized protein [Anoplolepis gracilipes]|uniref:uncharacterized protein n=1 Tax=Anoplolepis gracilipes TaxID=354296 RepID=UPI003B9EA26D